MAGGGVSGSTPIAASGGSSNSVAGAGGSTGASNGGAGAVGNGGGGDGGSAGHVGAAGAGLGGSATTGGAGHGGSAGSGVAGSATGGSAGQGGPSLCPVTGATLCDGFEDAAPGAANSPFTVSVTGTDTMVVDTTQFYRGKHSMKFSATAKALIVTSKIFAAATNATKATNNNLWGRCFILSNVPEATGYPLGLVVFGTLADSTNSGHQFNFASGSRGKLQAEIRFAGSVYTDDAMTPAAADPSYPIAADGWQCWEWQVQDDDSFDFFINGKEVPEMKITNGQANMSTQSFSPMPIFGGLSLGWQGISTSTISGWIDEVAVGPHRIGCDG